MADLKICDMCGKTIENKYEFCKTRLRVIRALLGIDLANYKEYDLCAGCAVKVRDYIEKGVTKEAREE